jgi:hypothetical protein
MKKECAASASEAVALLKIQRSPTGSTRSGGEGAFRETRVAEYLISNARRTEPRIERLMGAMFFEDAGRDERQLLNGLSEFGGHASRSNGYEVNSNGGARNLQMVMVGSIAWR